MTSNDSNKHIIAAEKTVSRTTKSTKPTHSTISPPLYLSNAQERIGVKENAYGS